MLEHGETIHEGLVREVVEETGVVVEPETLTGVYHNLPRGIVALVFRCRPLSGSPGPTDESAAVAWLTVDQVNARMTEAFAVRLLDAVAEGLVPAVRVHDGTHLLDAAEV